VYNRGYNRRGYGRHRDIGQEIAEKHIKEARELSSTLGGTDQTVKKYFFGLSIMELDTILTQYGRRYGESAESYARQTLPRWRSGRVQMSGMVAERLYGFLPPRMPIKTKYEIAEELWRYVGPSSSKTLRFGPGVAVEEIVANVGNHISTVVVNYEIPSALERRFNWLASDDVSVKQNLLNHLRSLDKSLVVEAARLQAGVMVQHLHDDQAKQTHLFAHTVTVGKHNLRLVADKDAHGCKFEEFRISERKIKGDSDLTWLWWLLAAAVVVGILLLS